MKHFRLMLAMLLVTPVICMPVLAANPNSQTPSGIALAPGARVRITAPALFSGKLIGTVVAIQAETLVVKHPASAGARNRETATSHFVLKDISRLDRSIGRKKDEAIMGALAGAAVGVGINALLANTVLQGEKSLALFRVSLPVIAVSAGLGCLINLRERWEEVPLEAIKTVP